MNLAGLRGPWWVLAGGDMGKVRFMKGAPDGDVQGGQQQEGLGDSAARG